MDKDSLFKKVQELWTSNEMNEKEAVNLLYEWYDKHVQEYGWDLIVIIVHDYWLFKYPGDDGCSDEECEFMTDLWYEFIEADHHNYSTEEVVKFILIVALKCLNQQT